MTKLEQAIRDAIEKGGYQPHTANFMDAEEPNKPAPEILGINFDVEGEYECPYGDMFELVFDESCGDQSRLGFMVKPVLLDADFWRALGKARGWGIEPSGGIWQGEEKCKIYWHHFIDHLAAGGDIESFFRTLREGITGNEKI